VLRAWLYEVKPDGTSHLMRPPTGRPMAEIDAGGTLYVSVEGGQNTPAKKYLKAPPAEGMSSDPVTVQMDHRTGFWMVQNSGITNTLRVQQYGLSAVPLRPQTSMPMAGRDGLFRDADWFPRLGGPDRTLANHLAAFHRLVELRTITLRRVCEWAMRHEVEPYVIIDRQLVPPR
jgi:hypothetical protein